MCRCNPAQEAGFRKRRCPVSNLIYRKMSFPKIGGSGACMKKRRTGRWIVLGVLVFAMTVLVYRYLPGKKWMSLEDYYGVSENGAALIWNTKNLQEQGIIEQGTLYLPLSFVQQMNSRYYWDGSQLLYTTTEGTAVYTPDSVYHLEDGQIVADGQKGCLWRDDQLWVALWLVQQYTDVTCTLSSKPERIWLWDDMTGGWEQAAVKSDCVIRYRAGIKSPILAQAEKGDTLLVLDDTSIPGWIQVQNGEGVSGYVKKKKLGERTAYTPKVVRHIMGQTGSVLPMEEPILMAWHQNLEDSGIEELPMILERSKGMDVIAPSWFTLSDGEGHLINRASVEYTRMAHEAGLQVWPMVDNLNLPVDSFKLLASTRYRTQLIEGLVEAVTEAEADGINVDFESLSESCGIHFVQFIRELSVACHKRELVLSVDNYAPQSGTWYYDRKEQAVYSDYLIVMAYDEHWNGGGEAGSTASYPFTEQAITDTLEEVPAGQLILAVPFYTRLWYEDDTSTAIGAAGLQTLLQEWKAKPVWLDREQQYFCTGKIEEDTVSVWIENLDTLKWRLELADTYQLAGVSGWKAGMEQEEAWDLMETYAEQKQQ